MPSEFSSSWQTKSSFSSSELKKAENVIRFRPFFQISQRVTDQLSLKPLSLFNIFVLLGG